MTWTFRLAAISNWLVGIIGFIDPTWLAQSAHIVPPNYPFLVRIWTGMVIMFGGMFWEISRDTRATRALIKYCWIEKCVTALSVTTGYANGGAPGELLTLIVLTDYLWIPIFMYCQWRSRTPR